MINISLPRENAEKLHLFVGAMSVSLPNDPTIHYSYHSSHSFWSFEFEALWQMVGLTVFLPYLISTGKCCPATVTSFPAVFADSWRSRANVHCNTRLRSKPRRNDDQYPGFCGLQYKLNIQRSGNWDPQYVCAFHGSNR